MHELSSEMAPPINEVNINRPPAYRVKAIALPNEHGSWGMLFEPLIAGLVVAWSPAAPFVALVFVGTFLTRQPLKVYIADRIAGRVRPHTMPAMKLAAVFSIIILIGLAGLFLTANGAALWLFVAVIPAGVVPILYDVAGKSRRVVPEIVGAVVLSSSAAVSVLAAEGSMAGAAALWLVFVCRMVPSLLYVRERLRLEKGKPFSYLIPVLSHAAALAIVVLLISRGLVSSLLIIVFTVLLTRALSGLSRFRQRLRAMQIGVLEMIYGLLVVVAVIVGHYANIQCIT
jgi:hypothetical protein